MYHTGVFTDVLNLVLREKPTKRFSAGRHVSAAVTTDNRMKRREMIISKCLQFLRFLAR